jgi:hypothetical protein
VLVIIGRGPPLPPIRRHSTQQGDSAAKATTTRAECANAVLAGAGCSWTRGLAFCHAEKAEAVKDFWPADNPPLVVALTAKRIHPPGTTLRGFVRA